MWQAPGSCGLPVKGREQPDTFSWLRQIHLPSSAHPPVRIKHELLHKGHLEVENSFLNILFNLINTKEPSLLHIFRRRQIFPIEAALFLLMLGIHHTKTIANVHG